MEDRLMECPFCGSKDLRRDRPNNFIPEYIHCEDCGGMNGSVAWNTRTTDSLMEKMADALEDLTERANRGREWLRTGPSGSGGNWGIFDTTIAEQALQEYRERENANSHV